MTGWLPLAIGAVALLYASVGHAGATGYVAVLALAGLGPDVVRPTALVLNVCVAAIATVQFARAGHLRRDLLVPLAIASVPAAFVGGAIALQPATFAALLGAVLAVSAGRLAVRAALPATAGAGRPVPPRPAALAALG
ncbi:MAG: TSUP family transporter, partial [Planctomycetaceae bacterium]